MMKGRLEQKINFSILKFQLSDEEDECWISDTRCRVAPRKFRANNVSVLIRSLENLREITVIMKDVNIKSAQSLEKKAKLTGSLRNLQFETSHLI